MKFDPSELMNCYRKLEDTEQTREVREMRLRLKILLDKIDRINALDDDICRKSIEMDSLIHEASRHINEIGRFYRIF